MLITIIEVRTNGKLYVLGEYNVLNKKGNAILYGMNRHINFVIQGHEEFLYQTRNQKQSFNYNGKHFVFESNNNDELIKAALKVAFDYLIFKEITIKEFKLIIKTELESENGDKYGFGSSSAILTGVIKSILLFHNVKNTNNLIFKLSVLAQDKLNDLSSGGDLASALNKGVIYYRRYNLKWFNKNKDNINIVTKKWPDLIIKKINSDFNFGAIWTKKSYKTKKLTYEISKSEYKQATNLVKRAYKNMLTNNYIRLKSNIKEYQTWLELILEKDELYTEELKKANKLLSKYNLASKISGAGGGDSVIYLYPKGYNFKNLNEEVKENNLKIIDI